MADIDTISIFMIQNIGNIDSDILCCSVLWLIANKEVNDVMLFTYSLTSVSD